MSSSPQKNPSREAERFAAYRGLNLVYEGRSEKMEVRAPDISPKGMFIHIPRQFPEGAVIKVEFWLSRSGHHVQARAEVRYCLPGVGIGVEFVDIADIDKDAIENEINDLMGR
jgi:hypothetical protein